MTGPNVLLLHCHDLGRYLGCDDRAVPIAEQSGRPDRAEAVAQAARTEMVRLTNLDAEPGHQAVRAELQHELYAWMPETADPLLNGATDSQCPTTGRTGDASPEHRVHHE